MIYALDSKPNNKQGKRPLDSQMSPVGVDEIHVLDGYYYLFWYRTVIY